MPIFFLFLLTFEDVSVFRIFSYSPNSLTSYSLMTYDSHFQIHLPNFFYFIFRFNCLSRETDILKCNLFVSTRLYTCVIGAMLVFQGVKRKYVCVNL